MRKAVFVGLATVSVLAVASPAAAAPAGGTLCEPARLSGRAAANLTQDAPGRHRRVMMDARVPAPYAAMRNPLAATKENVTAGRRLYEKNCAGCHGPKGRGGGKDGEALDPPPANIAVIMGGPVATDGFLMWTLSEGGGKPGTAMPAFRGALSEKERWQIILYLRTLSR